MENMESFDQHAIIPASVAPRDSMLALEPHVSPATSMGSCADTIELKVEDMCTGNCFEYSCCETMPLTEVWECKPIY